MNRWQRYARELRRRHGRADALRTHGAMVLLHARGLIGRVMSGARQTVLHVHARFAIDRRVRVTPVTVVHATRGAPPQLTDGAGAPARRIAFAARRPVEFATPHESALAHAAWRGGVQARTIAAGLRAFDRSHTALPRLAPMRHTRRPADAAPAVPDDPRALAARVRARARRDELPPPALPPVALVGHRAGPAVPAVARAPEPADGLAAVRRRPDEPVAARPAPAIDVDALTGLVIQQLDRRLIAYRERMGRG